MAGRTSVIKPRRRAWVGAAFAVAACVCGTRVGAQLRAEPEGVVEQLPRPGAHWVWVNDVSFFAFPDGRAFVVDGDRGKLLGMLSTGYGFTGVLVPKAGGVVYSPETYFSRGTRGTRTDVVTIYDAARLLPLGEIEIPPKRASVMPMPGAQALTDDDRFLLIYNFTPAQTVTVVDTRSRKFVGEIETAGCALVYPTGPRRFFSICGDGALLETSLTDTGTLARRARTAELIDVLNDPLSEKGVRRGDTWLFASFEGMLHPLHATNAGVKAERTWPLFTAQELAQHWRTGGLQHLAVHAGSGRLFAIVHQGGPETHKDLGEQVWVYDLASHKHVQTIPTRNKIGSIQVSQDGQPLLFTCSLESNRLDIYDATSGKYLRSVEQLGQTPTMLVLP
ncbi:MAG TPA: amine dehydrogenase large subunit [Steroidobacteraceae bacterium]|nr:amine dehydrogenase large subunit [Steroidobacteraceae bacterium]